MWGRVLEVRPDLVICKTNEVLMGKVDNNLVTVEPGDSITYTFHRYQRDGKVGIIYGSDPRVEHNWRSDPRIDSTIAENKSSDQEKSETEEETDEPSNIQPLAIPAAASAAIPPAASAAIPPAASEEFPAPELGPGWRRVLHKAKKPYNTYISPSGKRYRSLKRARDQIETETEIEIEDDICVGDRVYCAALPPTGNSRKLQLQWSGPVIVKEIINNALVRVEEYDVRNPRTYVAHRSKIRCAKKMGQKDVNPLFKLPRLPTSAIKELAEELSEFELPAIRLDAEVTDEFHPHSSEIRHGGRERRSSISSDSPIVPQILSNSSIAASSENSEDNLFQSFVQSPGSNHSGSSNPEQLFQEHFQVEDRFLDEMLRNSPDEEEELAGSAASLLPEPEPVKTTEPEESESGMNVESRRRGDDPAGINTPVLVREEQEAWSGEEMPVVINSPPSTNHRSNTPQCQ